MLIELQRLHGEIRVQLDALEDLTAQPAPPLGRLPAVRLALTRASRSRTLLLEGLHDQLVRGATPAQRVALEALKVEGKANLLLSAQHIGNWTLREITARWPDYCEASRRMRAAMRQRVAREIDIVYPLLSGRSAAVAGGAAAA